MHRLSRTIGSLFAACTLLCACHVYAQEHEGAVDESVKKQHAQEALKQARAALGGAEVPGKLQTFAVEAKTRRFVKYVSVQSPTKLEDKQKTLSGKVEFELAAPDKFRKRTSNETLSGFDFSFTEIINGERAWRDPPWNVRSFTRDSRVVDVGDVERTMLMQTRTVQQQIAIYALALLLQLPPTLPVEWSYEGVYQLGDKTADVIAGESEEGFRPVLLLDQKTHLPLCLALGYVEASRTPVMVEAAFVDYRAMRMTYERARRERQARLKPPEPHEMRWLLSDYRKVDGLLLPHRFTVTRDGETIEEVTLTEISVNRPLNPKRFEGEPKVKY